MTSSNKVAIITGASRGIGKAIALHLALAGYDIAVAARSVEGASGGLPGTIDETCAQARRLGRKALAVRCDLGRREDLDGLIDQTLARFGRVDVLVNNALYRGEAHWSPFPAAPWPEVEALIQINLEAPMYLAQRAFPHMAAQGGGLIANVTSGGARNENAGMPGQGATSLYYPVSKAGLDRFALGFAKEGRAHNIAAVNFDPGHTLTEQMMSGATPNRGFDRSDTQSVHVTARAIAWVATCPDPLLFSGRVLNARAFVEEHFLLEPDELRSPWVPDQPYDPYAEPTWKRLLHEQARPV
jgi:NAD(P)-dependent dehydrogenase (short-subunit alcohol dehydrogenase family)